MKFFEQYNQIKNNNLKGRYINFEDIQAEIAELPSSIFKVQNEGFSVLKRSIPSVTFGKGPTKILAWSQMHGNESTTTKAVFDLLKLIASGAEECFSILEKCTVRLIPMLNPDGAQNYTRENANGIDLNRDAANISQPETAVLWKVFEEFKPDFCFNLHDQRSIYSAGNTRNPATLSFLAPAYNESCEINEVRATAMKIIAGTVQQLQPFLKNKIGCFDDAFNINCTGDSFTTKGIPTILFEAGHFPGDYEREETRKFTAYAIFSALKIIAEETWKDSVLEEYWSIPQNEKLYFDVIIRNAAIDNQILDIAIQYEEELQSKSISFVPKVQEMTPKIEAFAHEEFDARRQPVFSETKKEISIGDVIKEVNVGTNKLSIKVG